MLQPARRLCALMPSRRRATSSLPPRWRHDNGSAVTIGAYDGVHIGHRRVIEQVRRRAADAGLRSVVVTFDKNPAAVINPASAPPRLTDLDQKLELLAATGVDQILVLHFDAERAKEPAEDFVTEVLVAELGARVVVVGDDFHFGNERRGNVALLREMGKEAGFSVEPVHLVAGRAGARDHLLDPDPGPHRQGRARRGGGVARPGARGAGPRCRG